MAWLVVEQDCSEWIYDLEPSKRGRGAKLPNHWTTYGAGSEIELPKGSIEKLIGKTLTWEDDAVELT